MYPPFHVTVQDVHVWKDTNFVILNTCHALIIQSCNYSQDTPHFNKKSISSIRFLKQCGMTKSCLSQSPSKLQCTLTFCHGPNTVPGLVSNGNNNMNNN